MSLDTRLTKNLDRVMGDLDLSPEDELVKAAESGGRPGPRRAIMRKAAARMTNLRIVEVDGVLTLEEQPLFGVSPRRRGPRRGIPTLGVVKEERPMSLLPYNKVTEKIQALDRKLTPDRGLRQWQKNGTIVGDGTDIVPVGKGKRILLFVHGTFSKSKAFFNQIDRKNFSDGRAFLNWAAKNYDQVLTFDHPTLSASPFVNAHQLSLLMGACAANIDIVCHSRGGLVTRWWVEALDRGRGKRRVAFVGAPLAGTGLASPHNLRSALNMAVNIGSAVTKASAAIPVLQFATGVFQVMTSVLRVAGKTPLADAVVAIVPGLAGQSRVGNNYELASLREFVNPRTKLDYFFVVSDFESQKVGWKFWKVFRKDQIKNKIVDLGTNVLFDGKNDLVVDTGSMTDLQANFGINKANILDFGTQDKVIHTNYFEQKETLKFIRSKFV